MNRTAIPISSRAAVVLPALGEFSPSYGKLCRNTGATSLSPVATGNQALLWSPSTTEPVKQDAFRRLHAQPSIRRVSTFSRLFIRDLRESVLKILPVQGETASAYRRGRRRSRRLCASQSFEVCCCFHVQARFFLSAATSACSFLSFPNNSP